jgi:hypothetical protein
LNLIPASSSSLPPGPHWASGSVSEDSSAIAISLPQNPSDPLAGAVVVLPLKGELAMVDWSRTAHSTRGVEEFSR